MKGSVHDSYKMQGKMSNELPTSVYKLFCGMSPTIPPEVFANGNLLHIYL